MKYDYRNPPVERKIVWGCAYAKGYNEKSTMLLKKPVKGMIIGDYFYELGKNGQAKMSPRVYSHSRMYADSYEESVQKYDDQVQLQICQLRGLISDCKMDLINIEGEIVNE